MRPFAAERLRNCKRSLTQEVRRGTRARTGKSRHFIKSAGNRWIDNVSTMRILDEVEECEKRCDMCRCTLLKNRCCSGCYYAKYCSPQCQKSHWRAHKAECRSLFGMISENMASSDTFADNEADCFQRVIPVREEDCSDSEWTLVSDSETEPEALV